MCCFGHDSSGYPQNAVAAELHADACQKHTGCSGCTAVTIGHPGMKWEQRREYTKTYEGKGEEEFLLFYTQRVGSQLTHVEAEVATRIVEVQAC